MFSFDGGHAAYGVANNGLRVCLDGKLIGKSAFSRIPEISFSPNGQHLAWIGQGSVNGLPGDYRILSLDGTDHTQFADGGAPNIFKQMMTARSHLFTYTAESISGRHFGRQNKGDVNRKP